MKKTGTLVIVLLIVLFAYMGYNYLSFRSSNAVSDAAFIKSDSLSILNFKVPGKIIEMNKLEGDTIKKGDILAKLDPKDFLTAKQKIENSIHIVEKNIEALQSKLQRVTKELDLNERISKNNINLYRKKIEALKLNIKANETKLKKLELDTKRYKDMLQKNLISKNLYEKISTTKDSLEDVIKSQKKELESLKINLKNIKEALALSKVKKEQTKEIEKNIEALQAKKQMLYSDIKEIDNKISYCTLYSPIDGKIAKKFVSNHTVVDAGYPIYSIINPKDLHVEVLLSEKKLHGVKVGNSVVIKPDALEGKEFKGKVISILPASASTFSLVPRDIASGEFTKLDQRFVVRISLDKKDGLLVGMSANIAIKREK